VACQYNEDASDQAKLQFDAKAVPHKFLSGQLVLMDEHSFLGKNQKLAPKWTSPHKVLRLKGDSNLEIQLRHNNRKTVVHANRLKPYFVASKNAAVFPDSLPTEPMPTPSQTPADDQQFPEPEDYPDTVCGHYCLSTWRPKVLYLPLQLGHDLELAVRHQLQLKFMTLLHLVLGQSPLQ
jgi:hypothetical protein